MEKKIQVLFDRSVGKNPTSEQLKGLSSFISAIEDHDLYTEHLLGKKAFTTPILKALTSGALPHFFPEKIAPLNFKYAFDFNQGPRPCMEDAHFIVETPEYLLSGVFDGHCDKGIISKLAAHRFPILFAKHLEKSGDVQSALRQTLLDIHAEIESRELNGGATVVVSHICRKKDVITVATLGDSEAFLAEKMEDGTSLLIPLSCIRNWKTDYARLVSHYDTLYQQTKDHKVFLQRKMVRKWHKTPPEDAKYLRVNSKNISNCLGDRDIQHVTSRDPTIVEIVASKGKLILTCDGLPDFWISHKAYIHQVIQPHWDNIESLAQESVAYSLKMQKEMFSNTDGDNVTVLVIEFGQTVNSKDSSSGEKSFDAASVKANGTGGQEHPLTLPEAFVAHQPSKPNDEGNSSTVN